MYTFLNTHVPGAVAVLRALHPDWGAYTIKSHLIEHGSLFYTHTSPDSEKEMLLDMQQLLIAA
jgi:hypothetical protein